MQTSIQNPFEGRSDQDVLRVTFADGRAMTGSYMTMVGLHFLTIHQGAGIIDKVEGPFDLDEIVKVEVLRTREDIFAERYERKIGERVPGKYRKTRSGYEARLRQIARIIAQTEDNTRRRELKAQFDEVADEIQLAKTKRSWMLCEAHHALTSNEAMRKRDLNFGDTFSLGKIQRPREQDFDPNPKVRRARVPLDERDALDPRSAHNLLKALRAAGYRADVSMTGEILDDVADLFVEFPGGKKYGRFTLTGTRHPEGHMTWEYSWHGNYTKADRQRMYRCLDSEAYREFRRIVAAGFVEAARGEIAA